MAETTANSKDLKLKGKRQLDHTTPLNGSLDHGQLAAGELVLEQPVAEVNSQVDAVHSVDAEYAAVVLHVHSHELVANLGRVLSRVRQTELRGLHFLMNFRVLRKVNLVGLDALGPPNVVQALPEEDHECKHDAEEARVGLQGNLVEVHCEGLVNQHEVAGLVIQIHVCFVVVPPAALLPRGSIGLQL